MFVNEYIMNRKRYNKWATPKFWRLPSFYICLVIFIAGVFGWIYFSRVDAPARWQTIGAFLTFVAVYRGVFFNWMHADKTFRLTRQKYFNEKDWSCRVLIREQDISLHINGKLNNRVEWEDIKKLEEARTYYKLTVADGVEGVMLDKACFTKGSPDDFLHWMQENHPEIHHVRIAPAFDK